MSGSITKVAVAGATGNLGPVIVNALLAAGFQVTALTRQGSTHTFPAGVTAVPVDYDSPSSLTSALKGQDAVVSTLASLALSKQLLLVDAAAAAGVKRFLPSEFGSDTTNEKSARLPCFADKVAVQGALKEKAAAAGGMTYTLVLSGPFFDWGIMVGFVMDVKNRVATLYDGGDRPFSTTSLATIGKAVVGVLQHPAETANRAVYVQDTVTTLRELQARGEKAAGQKFTENVVSVDGLVADAWAELKKEKPVVDVFVYNFIKASIWGEGYGSRFAKPDNELLGIKEMTDAEVQEVVARYV